MCPMTFVYLAEVLQIVSVLIGNQSSKYRQSVQTYLSPIKTLVHVIVYNEASDNLGLSDIL